MHSHPIICANFEVGKYDFKRLCCVFFVRSPVLQQKVRATCNKELEVFTFVLCWANQCNRPWLLLANDENIPLFVFILQKYL